MTTSSLAEAFVDSDREFWHGVLTGGGFTPIPRWTLDPVPGVAVCETPVPRDLLPALRQRPAELRVPLSSVLLAAHATVLAAISGEPEVVTGYLAGIRSQPLPCRLATAPGSWRAALLQAHRTEWELLAHQDFPVGDLAVELGLTGPAFETVFDVLGGEGTLAPGTVLWVSIWPQRGLLTLRLRYRTDVLDADAAARIAGYHLTALRLIAADPDAEHERQSLLSPAELDVQLDGLGCELGLTEPGSTATLGRALDGMPAVRTLFVETAYAEDHADGDPGIEVGPDQLAYIYFTSGSTGEPKGAMCEHAGMLNHLFAKIDDLRIDEGTVVAQTAPQCFDISLWQLIAALLVGGRTLLVEQEIILDAGRFIDKIVDAKVGIVQVVPSYLEVLESYLAQHPRELEHLRFVVATGEALKKELVERWFALQPRIKLVNAYGLTETSDDTNHEIMDRPPSGARVPLGRPVNNVVISLVDEDLSPVPLGVPGEIVFSGVCVGRGYINDPERTRRAFLADPHRPGQRLYRSGDYGRWLPDGKLEFLGRRDAQVKISGFRIEIGEIENTLLRAPGVREGAVVVAERADRSKHLVAFYSSDGPLDAGALRDQLGESLPAYMVPATFHWRRYCPVVVNSRNTYTAGA